MTPTALSKHIKTGQLMRDCSNQSMAVKMHMSHSNWCRKLRTPERLTVSELMRIEQILKIKIFTEESA